MSDYMKRMTKAQLRGLFKDYRSAFPEWSVEHDIVLTRTLGPVKQNIGFQALRDGAYRPSNSIHIAGAPGVGQLIFQFLDIRHREVSPREHPTMWPGIVKAMEDQFLPDIRKPLELSQVLQISENWVKREDCETPKLCSTLATLSAHLGDLDRSQKWCDRSNALLASMGRDLVDWELRLFTFNNQLKNAIYSGTFRSFLQQKNEAESVSEDKKGEDKKR